MVINLIALFQMAKPFISFVLILVVGYLLTKLAVKLLKKALEKTSLDKSLTGFLLKAVKIICFVFIILSALNSIGVSTTGIIAALSAATVAVGVALKDSLSNIAGGILLLISPRFHNGDYISTSGDEGTVINVDLLHTTIKTVDNKHISIPNGVLINSHITNYSVEAQRRVDLTFSISYDDNTDSAKDIIISVILKHPLVLNEPAPMARVLEYKESSVDIVARVWCNAADYWTVYFDLLEQVRSEFDKEGICIPYNQLDVHIKETK